MKAIYAFSGDPITLGHIDIIERAAATYNQVTVAIGANPAKVTGYLFTAEERLKLAKEVVANIPNVDCVIFKGLLAQYAYRNGYNVIIRGIRNNADLEAELILYNVNQIQFSSIDTVFFPTRPTLAHVSSSVVKALVREGGDVSKYVPVYVKQTLEQKICRQIRVGIAGGVGSGKSYVAQSLLKHFDRGIHIDLGQIGHYILSNSQEDAYKETRYEVAQRFGKTILNEDGSIDRQTLGLIVFKDKARLNQLNRIMQKPILARLYELCRNSQTENDSGELTVILLEGGLFVESKLTHLVNHCTILVTCPEDIKVARLVKRLNISEDEAVQKIKREISDDSRREYLQNISKHNNCSFFMEIHNPDAPVPEKQMTQIKTHIEQLKLI